MKSPTHEMRDHLASIALGVAGLFACAFGIPVAFRAAGFPQPVQSTLPEVSLWLLIPFIVFVGPLGEELVFRKWVISGLQKLRLSFLMAALLSTALWVASHVPASLQAGLIYASTGAILCLLRYRTDRLWTCVVAHMIYNAPAAVLLMRQ